MIIDFSKTKEQTKNHQNQPKIFGLRFQYSIYMKLHSMFLPYVSDTHHK